MNQKVDPFSGSDSTPIFPLNLSMIVEQIDRPNPVPWMKLFNLTKRRKDTGLLIFRNTDSGIFYIKVNIFFPESVAEKNVALSGEFQRIVQEIRNHLIEAYTVDFDCILFSLFWYEFNFDTGFGF